jgi:hypothetical protein
LLLRGEGGERGVLRQEPQETVAERCPGVGEDESLGAAVRGVRVALDQALLLQFVDDEGGVGGLAEEWPYPRCSG